MDNERRALLKLGAGAAIGALAADRLAAGHAFAANAAPVGPPIAPVPNGIAVLRLVTYAADGASKVGVVGLDGLLVDLAAAAKSAGMKLAFDPSDMISLAASGEAGLSQARKLAETGPKSGKVADARLLAPIPRPPRNVYAVGWNYLEHFEESQSAQGRELPKHPVFFTKGTHTVNGPYDPIPFDARVSTKIDWEGELAVVIGKRGRNIAEADALGHIFGFAVINDTTARDMQQYHGGQWFKGKSLDGHGPIGPWIVPASDIDHTNLRLQTRVNGVVKQDINTSKMYFKVPRLIAELSLGLTLEPGDIIATGTPSGVGNSRTPPEYLKPGDVMETEIENIGTIRNLIHETNA